MADFFFFFFNNQFRVASVVHQNAATRSEDPEMVFWNGLSNIWVNCSFKCHMFIRRNGSVSLRLCNDPKFLSNNVIPQVLVRNSKNVHAHFMLLVHKAG